ncbi:restriction endonuclease [Nocardia bovistercoris]|uniref:Restriction endonuclease n=1 Tax=Nocardia bovistercoris TaxID=2785916 RepID=A0A931IHL8_9NOCA|nr:restriction endonuclease [Nocardia bovistercoris]MBH0781556.1 restriction endonuclease [Nocardia bovistercoris]
MKVISPAALLALREALPSIVWYRKPFEAYVRAALADHPELLAGVAFSAISKREATDLIVDRLIAQQNRYFEITVRLILAVAAMESFPDVEKIKDLSDRAERLQQAKACVAELRQHTAGFSQDREREARRNDARAADADASSAARKFNDDLDDLKARFIALHQMNNNPQERGRRFERFLNDLFELFDLEPRLSYVLNGEQIDGSFSFDTDDYIVEAKWTKEPIGRDQLDILDSKVRRRGKNALGAFFSASSYTSTALGKYSEGSTFIAVDGQEIFLILEGRVRLDEVLRNKKRHVNDTGSCMLHTSEWLVT